MWQEFGAFIRGEDVAKYMGKATGAKEAVAKAVAAREKALRDRFDPSARPTRIKPGARPNSSVGGGRGTNPGNTGFTTKPPVKTPAKPVYDSIRRTPVTSPKPRMIGNPGVNGSMIGNRSGANGSMIGNKSGANGSMIGNRTGRNGSMIGKKKK